MTTRWEERGTLSAAAHLRAIDYDLDELERRQMAIDAKLSKIFGGVLLAVISLVANLLMEVVKAGL